MSKKSSSLLFHKKAQKKLLEGVQKVLSPCLSLYRQQSPLAYEMIPEEENDPFCNLGILLAKKALDQMQKSCFDGKKTMLILLHAFLAYGLAKLEQGIDPFQIKKDFLEVQNLFFQEIENQKQEIRTSKDLETLITYFPLEEKEKKLLLEALVKMGKRGTLCVLEGDHPETSLSLERGIKIPYGYASPYFITHTQRMCAELVTPKVFFLPEKIISTKQLSFFVDQASFSPTPLLILVKDISGEALSTLVMNKLQNTSLICALKEPSFFPDQKKVYKKLQKEILLQEMDKAYVFKTQSLFLGNFPSSQNLALLFAGGETPLQKKEKKAQLDTYVQFLRSARKEGILIGGISLFLRFSHFLQAKRPELGDLFSSFFQVFGQDLPNHKELVDSPLSYGYNLQTQEVENFSEKGIFDAVHTTKMAFSIALEQTIPMLLTNALIT